MNDEQIMARLCEIEKKLDILLDAVNKLSGMRAFSTDILANIIGNVVTR